MSILKLFILINKYIIILPRFLGLLRVAFYAYINILIIDYVIYNG